MSKIFTKADDHGAHPGKWGLTIHEEGVPAKFLPASDEFCAAADAEQERLSALFDADDEVDLARHLRETTKKRQEKDAKLARAAKKRREAEELEAEADDE